MHYQTIFIGVNYKTPTNTLEWVKSLILLPANCLSIVVDNSHADNPTLKLALEQLSSRVLYLDATANLGYLNGAALAYDYLQKENITFDWLCVSNVDVILKTPDLSILHKYTHAGMVAPAIISVDTKQNKNPYKLTRLSKIQMYIKKYVFCFYPLFILYSFIYQCYLKLWHQKLSSHKYLVPTGCDIYMPYGACMFFSKTYFAKGGTIHYPLFLFGEEIFVAEQCRKLGLAIKYVPEIQFDNYDHASTSKLSSPFITQCNYKAISYILKTYY